MPVHLEVRRLTESDVPAVVAAFAAVGWHKPAETFERYLAEQAAGTRMALLALLDGQVAGYGTLCWQPAYAPLADAGVPEVQDLNVLPWCRRRGIGTRLLDEVEWLAAERSTQVGIGVGLYADYGAAQRLYVKRGYVPDGRGVTYANAVAEPGGLFRLDDDLVLHFTRRLRAEPCG